VVRPTPRDFLQASCSERRPLLGGRHHRQRGTRAGGAQGLQPPESRAREQVPRCAHLSLMSPPLSPTLVVAICVTASSLTDGLLSSAGRPVESYHSLAIGMASRTQRAGSSSQDLKWGRSIWEVIAVESRRRWQCSLNHGVVLMHRIGAHLMLFVLSIFNTGPTGSC